MTTITHLSGTAGKITWTSEIHRNDSIVRYFNGRRYDISTEHSFSSSVGTYLGAPDYMHWATLRRFTSVEHGRLGNGHQYFDHYTSMVYTDGPSVLGRTTAALYPEGAW